MAAMKRPESADSRLQDVAEARAIYDRFGKPLEATHTGEFLAVSKYGKTLVGTDLLIVAKQATERFGPGSMLFKIGDVVVGKLL